MKGERREEAKVTMDEEDNAVERDPHGGYKIHDEKRKDIKVKDT